MKECDASDAAPFFQSTLRMGRVSSSFDWWPVQDRTTKNGGTRGKYQWKQGFYLYDPDVFGTPAPSRE